VVGAVAHAVKRFRYSLAQSFRLMQRVACVWLLLIGWNRWSCVYQWVHTHISQGTSGSRLDAACHSLSPAPSIRQVISFFLLTWRNSYAYNELTSAEASQSTDDPEISRKRRREQQEMDNEVKPTWRRLGIVVAHGSY